MPESHFGVTVVSIVVSVVVSIVVSVVVFLTVVVLDSFVSFVSFVKIKHVFGHVLAEIQ